MFRRLLPKARLSATRFGGRHFGIGGLDTRAAYHTPVMVEECLLHLDVRPGGLYVDCTLGGGGHSRAILERGGHVIGIDQDPNALAHVANVCKDHIESGRLEIMQANFRDAAQVILTRSRLYSQRSPQKALGTAGSDTSTQTGGNIGDAGLRGLKGGVGLVGVDGVLMDLGVSSHQIDEASRGFAFGQDGPLDMRMHQRPQPQTGGSVTATATVSGPIASILETPTAKEVVNTWDADDIANLLKTFGDETNSKAIAKQIVLLRPLNSTSELAEAISRVTPWKRRNATLSRCFQALRIVINDEMNALQQALEQVHSILKPSGRLVVLSYHSIEDRIVKNSFRNNASALDSSPILRPLPISKGRTVSSLQAQAQASSASASRLPVWEPVLKKALLPTEAEIATNGRARSAKLRCARPAGRP